MCAFVESFLLVPKGTGALEPVRLRRWQRNLIAGTLVDPRPRQGLLSLPRGNGKSPDAVSKTCTDMLVTSEHAAAPRRWMPPAV